MPRSDNVTPFRPRRPPPKPQRGNPLKSHRGKVVLVHALTLAAFGIYAAARFFLDAGNPITFLGLALGIAGVAIAASNRHEGMPWAVTHHEHALRTIVIGAATWTVVGLLALLPMMLPFVFWSMVVIAAWVLLRAGVDLALAALRRPIPNPRSLLF